MNLKVPQKIIAGELVIVALICASLVPYILATMDFPPLQLFHYITITLFVLIPLSLLFLLLSVDRWECRPLVMLSFYRERRMPPPGDILDAARIRALNLPLIHACSVLIRYEIVCFLGCLYMGTTGGLSRDETIRLGLYSCVGMAVFPIFSFFLTERFLYPTRRALAEMTRDAVADESKVIHVSTRLRLVSIMLATVMTPVIALGVLVFRWVGVELATRISDVSLVRPIMWQLSDLVFIVIMAALVLAAGVGILLAASISTPLDHMLEVIRQLDRGNFRARMDIISNDEIGVVSRSFDMMARGLDQNRTQLEELNRTLELRVKEKTVILTDAYDRLQLSNQSLEIANRELEEANRKLKEIDQLKSDFISIVSHELRTPLTSIKAFTELILMKPNMTPEKQERLLHIINNETDRLTRLVNNVLDLTKIEAGNLGWQITRLSMDDIVRTSVSGIQSLAESKGLFIEENVPHSLPRIRGDRDRLIQVITNIISNSIKFTPQGGKISVAARYEAVPEPRIVVSVADTGIGIPEQDHKLIFEKFGRAGDLLTSHVEGTGLGLAITRLIVEYHGGTIWVRSKPGEGSTFQFSLPLNKHRGAQDRAFTHTRL